MGTSFVPDTTNPMAQRFDAIRNRQQTTTTPGHSQYMQRQLNNIVASGGSEEDVMEFLKSEEVNAPRPISVERLTAQPGKLDKLIGNVRGLSQRALQGVTFGFGDEAIGALEGLLTGVGARAGIDQYRAEMEQWTREHKKTGFAAEIAGSLLTGGLLIKGVSKGFQAAKTGVNALTGGKAAAQAGATAVRTAAPTAGQRAVAAAGQGAVGGAISAAGHTEGNISDRTKNMLWGAALGGVAGGGIVTGARFAGGITRTAVRSVTRGMEAIQKRIPGIGTPIAHAREIMARSLAQDNISIPDALARAAQMRANGITPTVADLGGKATLELGQASLRSRNPVTQKLTELMASRQGEQGERVAASFFGRMFRSNKMGIQNSYHAEDLLQAAQKQVADRLYPEAYKHTITLTPRLQGILRRPEFREAWEAGKKLADDQDFFGRGHGLKVPELPKAGPTEALRKRLEGLNFPKERIEAELAKLPQKGEIKELPVRGLDLMKRELDDIIRGKINKGDLSAERGRTLLTGLNEALDEVDNQVLAYAKARAAFRGFAENRNAIDAGRKAFSEVPEVIERQMAKLSPSERDFFRVGYAEMLHTKLTGQTSEAADVARRFTGGRLFSNMNNPEARRIRALFPEAPEAADDFMRQVAGETRVSLTSQRFAQGAAARAPVQAAEEVLEGGPTPSARATVGLVVLGAGRQLVERARTGWTNDVSDELAILFSKGIDNADELTGLLLSLREASATLAARSKVSSRAAVAIGEVAGQIF